MQDKAFYKFFGVFQILMAIFCFVFFFPNIYETIFSSNLTQWQELTQKVLNSPVGIFVEASFQVFVVLTFVLNFFCLFRKKSLASTFFKLSILTSTFGFLTLALDSCFSIFGQTTTFSNILSFDFCLAILCLSVAFFLAGFVLWIVLIKKGKNRTSSFLVAKAFLWLVLCGLNFLAPMLDSPNWFSTLFFYSKFASPIFLTWLFFILGFWQVFSAPKKTTQET